MPTSGAHISEASSELCEKACRRGHICPLTHSALASSLEASVSARTAALSPDGEEGSKEENSDRYTCIHPSPPPRGRGQGEGAGKCDTRSGRMRARGELW